MDERSREELKGDEIVAMNCHHRRNISETTAFRKLAMCWSSDEAENCFAGANIELFSDDVTSSRRR